MNPQTKAATENAFVEGSQGIVVEVKEASKHLERILQSESLKASPNLRRLLEYIGTRSIDGRGGELKEYTIGVEALDRSADFDPKTDTIVRVQIHRLREKLSRYYMDEGRDDDVLITIPRGHYTALFLSPAIQAQDEDAADSQIANQNASVLALGSERKRRFNLLGAISGCLLAAVVVAFFAGRHSVQKISTNWSEIDPGVADLWNSFLAGDKAPIIGFPDAVFLIDESNDLLRYRSGASSQRGSSVEPHLAEQFASNPGLVRQAGPLFYEDGYTGTGEVESAANLAALFRELGAHAQIKRSRDITIDDLRSHNVVLLGSSFQNKTVDELPEHGDFEFVKAGLRHEIWGGAITNAKPVDGESAVYKTERDSITQALISDYALVSFQPGLTPERHIVILGGLDTTGTAGATQFATSPDGAALLLKSRSVQRKDQNSEPVVQAIIHCILKDGNNVFGVEPVAIHTMEWKLKNH